MRQSEVELRDRWCVKHEIQKVNSKNKLNLRILFYVITKKELVAMQQKIARVYLKSYKREVKVEVA